MKLEKSLVVNLCCLLLIGIGYVAPQAIKPQVLGMGFFGFSGAITNWLAIHMLFEKVPGLYGSGIIPLKFEAFKSAIRNLIMNQFFTRENIKKFSSSGAKALDLTPIIEGLDYDSIFESFLEVVKKSKFGSMLGMFGGAKALEPMREPFVEKLKTRLGEMTSDPTFWQGLSQSEAVEDELQGKITDMVDHRLAELTPQMVKQIIQDMIRSHLGWLVVWGGVFGALIGLVSSFAF